MTQQRPMDSMPGPSQVAEAAAWVAHLHCAERTADSDRGLKLWIKDDPARQRAWELATEVWEDLRLLPTSAVVQELEATRGNIRAHKRNVGIVTALAATFLIGIVSLYWLRDGAVTTGIGEQRTLLLKDGTQVTLNTATRIVVHMDGRQRRVDLEAGEALFDVAQHANAPFVVVAGDREIKALGTAFVVRRDPVRVSVTLMDGKVSVSQSSADARSGGGSPGNRMGQGTAVVLTPGQRLTFVSGKAPRLDQPPVDKLTAWRHGKVVFENARLTDAVAEMNRYSTRPLVVEDPGAAEIHVSGAFKYGDSLRFAEAVAVTYQLEVVETPDGISLVGVPERAYR